MNKPKQKKYEPFSYGLETELRENPAKRKELLEKTESDIQELKKALRTGVNDKEFDHLGTLLHGFVSLQKVVKRMVIK